MPEGFSLIKADAGWIPLRDKSVNCCITSPPYWGMRKYGGYEMQRCFGNINDFHRPTDPTWWTRIRHRADIYGGRFNRDRASWIGALGLEPTPEMYVEHMVMICREIRRVLRKDGTLWLNLGAVYSSGGRAINERMRQFVGDNTANARAMGYKKPPPNYKLKELIGIPWMVAMALQADGWYLRSEIIWSKPNPLPESVKDRPTRAHEQIFLLSRSRHYYYDYQAIQEPSVLQSKEKRLKNCNNLYGNTQSSDAPKYPSGWAKNGKKNSIDHNQQPDSWKGKKFNTGKMADVRHRITRERYGRHYTGRDDEGRTCNSGAEMRNKRSVWTYPTQPYHGAHYATFPAKMIEPCVLAGCPEGGIVLDPFLGSGTTVEVAVKLHRYAIGLDLGYQDLQRKRIARSGGLNGKLFSRKKAS